MKAVLFDLDGTLLWTDGAGRRAIHRALLEVLAIERPAASFRFDGRTDPEIVELLAAAAGRDHGPDVVAGVLRAYVRLLDEELGRPGQRTTVYPGVRELLAALERRSDCVLGLLTGNVREGARLKLRSAGLDIARFRVGAFGSDHGERSALPAIAQQRVREVLGLELAGHDVVIMGDTPADVTCGRGIGARAIAVATGSYSVPDLIAAGAYTAFADFSDTAAVVASAFAP
ncbi:MAG TPA: HAD family hydrolase [Gemmatimonadales bacterium]|nr:HAD family hydrolase [Gemmatimonadales bacterium]